MDQDKIINMNLEEVKDFIAHFRRNITCYGQAECEQSQNHFFLAMAALETAERHFALSDYYFRQTQKATALVTGAGF